MKITETYAYYATLYPDHPAIVTQDRTISYRQWERLVQQTAAAFSQEHAIRHRVAIFLPNGYLFLQMFAGASEAGWVSIVGDMRWKKEELDERLRQTTPDLIIADSSMEEKLQSQRGKVIYTKEIDEWIRTGEGQVTDERIQPHFYIGFTSGSTGQPKAFVRSHFSWVESFRCNQVDLNIKVQDHVAIPGSFVNSTFLYGALSTLYLGGTVYVLKKFSPARLIQFLNDYPIAVVYVVPTMLQAFIDGGWKNKQRLAFISTGAKLLPTVKNTIKKNFPHATFNELYGASELSFISVLKDKDQKLHGDSVGQAVHNVDISIRNEQGEEVACDEAGVLYVKSNMLFDGYMNHTEETNDVFAGDWATVHDIAKKDKDGYIYLLGRKNDMILYGGMNIYPQEIEKVLKRMDGVDDVVVFGVKDTYWGEKVAVCIKGNVSLRELKAYSLKVLTSYKVPRIWRKVERFPITSGGKISRQEVKKWLEAEEMI